jgi:hypothetical protein
MLYTKKCQHYFRKEQDMFLSQPLGGLAEQKLLFSTVNTSCDLRCKA